MSGVSFDGVTKRFDGVTAVDQLTLDVVDGEFMVLLGPSGCGKSTALRMIAGLETVTEGVLSIGDQVVNDVEAKNRDIAMVFQSYALYPHMTVAQNIEFPLKARKFAVDGGTPRKLTADERRDRVADAVKTLGLQELTKRKPGALSGGQRQRVALARSIVRRPEVFLMDEPLSNLDAKLRAQTRIDLVNLHREVATTFVYVTHDQVEAMTMADRMAVMSDGRLQQVGTPEEVYERPANLFVARFIGSPPMNTVAGEVVERGVVACGSSRVPFQGDVDAGRQVVVGIRPENLHVGEGTVEATVQAVEWLGHERHVIVDIAGSRAIVRQETDEGAAPALESTISLHTDAAHVHVFDAETTERLN
jgi:multiple sugar transport system ATP-binding protein